MTLATSFPLCTYPVSVPIVSSKSLKHIYFYHCCITIFLDASNNLYSNNFLRFSVPAFKDLTKGAFSNLPEDLILEDWGVSKVLILGLFLGRRSIWLCGNCLTYSISIIQQKQEAKF
uniref:Uncharacterized protein n=1 Tax=Opuntia streptacantha TaxID=393608 RepID=A0A7C8Z6T0_OPUST